MVGSIHSLGGYMWQWVGLATAYAQRSGALQVHVGHGSHVMCRHAVLIGYAAANACLTFSNSTDSLNLPARLGVLDLALSCIRLVTAGAAS